MDKDILDSAREELIEGCARIKDIEVSCYPKLMLCNECWQLDKYCITMEWERLWEQLELHPNKYYKS